MTFRFHQLALLCSLPLASAACGPGTATDGPAEPVCSTDNNCLIADNGEPTCVDGFEWESADDAANLNCVDIPIPPGLAILGQFDHTVAGVELTEVFDGSISLDRPRDLAFNPAVPGELWVTSQGSVVGDSAIVVIDEAGTPTQSSTVYGGPGNGHFLARPSGIAFGDNGLFATSQDEDEETQGPVALGGSPVEFMGPTLWPSNRTIFNGGHAAHMDMLHNSPNSAGVAWDEGNVYWIYDGWHSSITRYDFATDHGPGGADHTQADVSRYCENDVGYVDGVSSHLVVDHETDTLYIAETSANKILALDTTTGNVGQSTYPNFDGSFQYLMDDAVMIPFVDGAEIDGLTQPSGIELRDNHLFVSDYATGFILAFDLDGVLVDWIDTGLGEGALMGMAFDDRDGSLYFVDARDNRIMRMAPKAAVD